MRYRLVTLLASAALFAATSSAQYQDRDKNHKGSAERMKTESNNVAAGDRMFATKAAVGGMAEVNLGNLAKDHASNQAVKDFGNRMVTDHSKANDQLKDWASKNNVTLPTDVNAKEKAEYDRLSKLNGAEFDKVYMEHMLKDHREDIAEFRKEADRGTNADLKSWASNTLPTLEDHLKQAETVASEVGARGSSHAHHEKSAAK